MARLIDLGFHAMKVAVALLLAAMVAMVFGNVFLRYVFNSGIVVSEELSRWCLVWMTFIGAVVALRERQHLGMDVLIQKLPLAGKKACLVVSHLLMLYVTWLFLAGSWRQTLLNYDVPAPVTNLSTGWFYGIGVFFSVLAGLILLNDLYRVLAGKAAEAELIGVVESEEQSEIEQLRGAGAGR